MTFERIHKQIKQMTIPKVEFRPKILDTFHSYNAKLFASDAMSGIIVAIVAALPLALAFAIASGLSPEMGLLSAIIGGFIIATLSGCRVQIGGPSGSFIIIAYSVVHTYGLPGLVMATMLAGLMLLIMGATGMGKLIRFIPFPVVMGFTAGMAVIIFSTQVNELFGLGLSNIPADFLSKWLLYLKNLDHVDWASLAVGLGTVALIQLAPRIIKAVPGSLIALILSTVIVYLLRTYAGVDSVATIGDKFSISGTLPNPTLPPLDFSMLAGVAQPAFSIAILAAIESLLTARIVDGIIEDKHRPNTELIAIGIANLISPIIGAMPVTGATARTMTNINNGGTTPMAGIIHTLVLLLCFLVLMPLVSYVPLAGLAGVLVVVSINMSGWHTIRTLMRGPRTDVLVLWVTFTFTLIFDITFAIETGLLLSMLFFIKRMIDSTHINVSRDKLALIHSSDDIQYREEERLDLPHGVEVYEIEGPFFFGVANYFEEVMSNIAGERSPKVRIIRMRYVPFMDTTAIHNLTEIIRNSHKQGVSVILSGVSTEVRQTLKQSKITALIGEDFICPNIHEALDKAKAYLEQSEETNQTRSKEFNENR